MPLRRLSLWPGLSPGMLWQGRSDPPVTAYPLADNQLTTFGLARHGLHVGARALGLGAGDEILVPAYHHGSEVEALRRLGAVPRFYDVGEDLKPEPSHLERLMTPRVRALLLIHYFGFPQDVATWRRWCDDLGIWLLEDAAQAWLGDAAGQPIGSFGDVAIFCPYKTVGIPRVGLLRLSPGHALDRSTRQARRHTAGGEAIRLGLRWGSGRLGWLAAALQPFESSRTLTPDADQALGRIAPPSLAAARLLRHVDTSSVAPRRRANYAFLLGQLRHLVPRALHHLPAGASPLVFPINTRDGRSALGHFNGRRILARPFWPNPHPLLPVADHPNARQWRSMMIALPVHQQLDQDDLDLIVETAQWLTKG
jgi:dTDP-4-amino-4,6-dideoxygalactose transaminase